MSDQLWDDLFKITTLAALVSLAATIYRFLAGPSLHARHHAALSEFVRRAADPGWLELLRRGVLWILGLMSIVYGPINEDAPHVMGRYLTPTAWRMSAWIASLYIWVVIPLFLAGLVVAGAVRSPEQLGVEFVVGLGVILGFGGAMLATHIAFLKAVRQPRQFGSLAELSDEGLRGIATAVAGMSIFAATPLAFALFKIDLEALGGKALLGLWLFAGLVSVGRELLRTIGRFGFYAPLAVIAQIGIGMTLALHVLMGAVAVLGLAGGLKAGALERWGWPALAMLALCCAAIAAFIIGALVMRAPRRRLYQSLALALAAGVAHAFLAGRVEGWSPPMLFTLAVLAWALKTLVPWVLIFYGVIFANAFPDWISVGLTRFVLGGASRAATFASFGLWLLADLGVVLICLALSYSILSVATGLSWLASVDWFASGPVTPSEAARGFSGGSALFQALIMLVTDGPKETGAMLSGLWQGVDSAAFGFKAILGLTLVGCIALLPTALNMLTITSLVMGRLGAILLGPPVRRLHALLALPEDSSPEDKAASYWRSAGIFGVLGAVGTVVVLGLVHWIGGK